MKLPQAFSPLTDPRSLASSVFFHAVLLLIASVAVLGVTMRASSEAPQSFHGELEPTDNRAPVESSGGGPGELGGEGLVAVQPAADGRTPAGAALDPAADALLSEILPAQKSPDTSQRALPGPLTTGIGAIPSSGVGGGGGSGGGSGGGVGSGIGPGTEFFGTRDHARSFAYVIDCSGSMASRNALEVAKRELTSSLNQLPDDARFAVIFYNLYANIFSDPQGLKGLMPATATNKSRVGSLLARVAPDGGTDHMLALRTALALRPEVIFFLTDADLMTNSDVQEILSLAGSTRIQAFEFGRGMELDNSSPLRRLATATGGRYRYMDVTRFPQTVR